MVLLDSTIDMSISTCRPRLLNRYCIRPNPLRNWESLYPRLHHPRRRFRHVKHIPAAMEKTPIFVVLPFQSPVNSIALGKPTPKFGITLSANPPSRRRSVISRYQLHWKNADPNHSRAIPISRNPVSHWAIHYQKWDTTYRACKRPTCHSVRSMYQCAVKKPQS